MTPLVLNDVNAYIEKSIGSFHEARLAKIRGLTLKSILGRKNPYLFKAKGMESADQLIRSILDAFLSSGEETMFGNFLEELAIFVNSKVYGGKKAAVKGIDLDFENDGTRYFVSIKSGPSWGNAEAIERMIQNFNTAKKTLSTGGGYKGKIEFVNGCCYGVDNNPVKDKGYHKYCGQRFWHFVSGRESLYEELLVPLGHGSDAWNKKVREVYETTRVRLMGEIVKASVANQDGEIDWVSFARATSAAAK